MDRKESFLGKQRIFCVKDALKHGISRKEISKLVADKRFLHAGRGVYYNPSVTWESAEAISYSVVALLFPKECYIGGFTALGDYNLTEIIAKQTWIMAPLHVRTSMKQYRIIRSGLNLEYGVENIDGLYRIASIERALIDAFYYSYIFGRTVAYVAAKTALIEQRTTLSKLHDLSEKLGTQKSFDSFFDYLTPEALQT